MGLRIARLQLGPPSVAAIEPVGDPIAGVGGAVVPAPRVPQQVELQLNTVVTAATTVAQAQAIRRQLRSMLNNTPLKLQGFLYIVYDDDTEINGWYTPDVSQIESRDATSFIAGVWETAAMNFSLQGHQRTHREARQAWAKNLTLGIYQRDVLGWIYSLDFVWMTPLALIALPPGAASSFLNVQWQAVPLVPLPTGADGGICQQTVGLADLSVVTYERPEASFNLGDVVVYDRRGQITAPGTQADTNWLEVYGPDWAWAWLPSGTADAPVLANGLCRVRYNAANTDGFSVDVWNGSAYVEQGKMLVQRLGGTTALDTTWVSASLREWTPERAVVVVQLSNSATDSGETVYITMARGVIGATFECYPATDSNGTPADAQFLWSPALNAGAAYANATLVKIDSHTGAVGFAQIADVFSGGDNAWPGSPNVLGAASFTGSENYVALLIATGGGTPAPTAFQTNFAVVQAGIEAADYGSDTNAYGVADYVVALGGTGATNFGYVQASIAFAPTVADQLNEAEVIRNSGSGTTSQVSDGTASNGLAVKDTQAAATNPTLTKASNLLQAKYRLIARAHSDGGSASFQAKLGATASSTVTTLSTSWTWLDLGDVLSPSASPTLNVTGWGGTLAAPTGFTGAQVTAGGTLSGTLFWKITALNAQGETTGSSEFTTTMSGGHNVVNLSWTAVPGATGYKIYRATVTNGESGATQLVTTIGSGATVAYSDTGSALTTGGVPGANTAVFNAYIDCYRAILVEDRTRSIAIYSGARDSGVAQLTDSRALGALTARA